MLQVWEIQALVLWRVCYKCRTWIIKLCQLGRNWCTRRDSSAMSLVRYSSVYLGCNLGSKHWWYSFSSLQKTKQNCISIPAWTRCSEHCQNNKFFASVFEHFCSFPFETLQYFFFPAALHHWDCSKVGVVAIIAQTWAYHKLSHSWYITIFLNLAVVIWRTTQVRTSWTSRFKFQESYDIKGGRYLKTGTFSFRRSLKTSSCWRPESLWQFSWIEGYSQGQ